MLRRAGDRLTYANVMATIAVFIALGGGAYAATRLPRSSVGAPQIKPNAVTSPKVKDGSLLARDFKAGQLPGGSPGAKGDTGPQGAPGTPGQSIKGDPGSAAASAVFGGVQNLGTLAPSATVTTNPAADLNAPGPGQPLTPNTTVTLRDFAVHETSTALPANVSLTFTLSTDSGSIACTIPSGSRDCNTGAQTTTAPPGTYISLSIQNTGTASYPSSPEVDWGWRLTG